MSQRTDCVDRGWDGIRNPSSPLTYPLTLRGGATAKKALVLAANRVYSCKTTIQPREGVSVGGDTDEHHGTARGARDAFGRIVAGAELGMMLLGHQGGPGVVPQQPTLDLAPPQSIERRVDDSIWGDLTHSKVATPMSLPEQLKHEYEKEVDVARTRTEDELEEALSAESSNVLQDARERAASDQVDADVSETVENDALASDDPGMRETTEGTPEDVSEILPEAAPAALGIADDTSVELNDSSDISPDISDADASLNDDLGGDLGTGSDVLTGGIGL